MKKIKTKTMIIRVKLEASEAPPGWRRATFIDVCKELALRYGSVFKKAESVDKGEALVFQNKVGPGNLLHDMARMGIENKD